MRRGARIAVWAGVVIIALVVAVRVVLSLTGPLELPPPPEMTTFVVAAPPPPRVVPPPPQVEPDLQRRVFLDVNVTPPAQVFAQLARAISCALTLDPRVARPVTLRLSNVTARTALSAICESIGCRWQLTGRTLIVDATAAPPPIPQGELLRRKLQTPVGKMNFEGVPFKDAVDAISRQSGIEITVDNVDPLTPVTVDASGDAPFVALEKVMRSAGWSFKASAGWRGEMRSQGDTLSIRIVPQRKIGG